MKTKLVLICVFSSLFAGIRLPFLTDKVSDQPVEKERTICQGPWKLVGIEADGIKLSEDDLTKFRVINRPDGGWIVKLEDVIIWQGISTIDPTKYPKTIDFIPTEGADIGMLYLGIYEIGTETRRLCYAEPSKSRPTEFTAKSGSGRVLVELQRELRIARLPAHN